MWRNFVCGCSGNAKYVTDRTCALRMLAAVMRRLTNLLTHLGDSLELSLMAAATAVLILVVLFLALS